MGKVRFELNKAGVRELLKSPQMAETCNSAAERVRAAAGTGYVVESRNYPERAGAVVYADTGEAKRDNYKNNTLLKALGGAG